MTSVLCDKYGRLAASWHAWIYDGKRRHVLCSPCAVRMSFTAIRALGLW